MRDYERRVLLERIIVLMHGICGGFVGIGAYLFLLVAAVQMGFMPQSVAMLYVIFIGLPIVSVVLGFYLAVRKDWWVMKRRW